MNAFYWLLVGIFVLICIVDVYLDVMYRGAGAWLLSHGPFRLPRESTAARVVAPFIGFSAVLTCVLAIVVVTYALCYFAAV